jgi:carboxylesterase
MPGVTLLAGAEPYRHEGGPVGALLCHGFTGTPQSLRGWAEYLAEHGLTVRLPRLPGHGTRWQELNRTTWHDWYAEEERALLELSGRCETVIVMGLSMGGTLALRLAEQHREEVDGLVLVNASVHSEDRRLRYLPILKRIRPSVAAIGNDVKREGSTELAYTRTPLHALDSLRELWRLTVADLGRIDQPVLLFRSAEDHVVEASNAARILDGISSTDVEERICPDSYHVATLDHDDHAIFEGSLGFSRRIAVARTAG